MQRTVGSAEQENAAALEQAGCRLLYIGEQRIPKEECRMSAESDVLVFCPKRRGDPALGPFAVMVSMERDVALVKRRLGAANKPTARMFSSRLYQPMGDARSISLVGPVLGAPYAVMILEKLYVLGVRKVLFLGWCGSVASEVRIGEIVVPDCAVIGEGTSRYYLRRQSVLPSMEMTGVINASAGRHSLPVHNGPVWSTDAPYRETVSDVLSLQKKGVLAVDMEVSALFSAGAFRGMSVGALLIVSDELGSLEWVRGFSGDTFKRGRRIVGEIVEEICQRMM